MNISNRNDRILLGVLVAVVSYVVVLVLLSYWTYLTTLILSAGTAIGVFVYRQLGVLGLQVLRRRMLSPLSALLMTFLGAFIGSVYIGRIKTLLARMSVRFQALWLRTSGFVRACPFVVRSTIILALTGMFVGVGWILVGLAASVPAVAAFLLRRLLLEGLDRIVLWIVRPLYAYLHASVRKRGITKHVYVQRVRRGEARLLRWLRIMRKKLWQGNHS